jgi:hypothetical protein
MWVVFQLKMDLNYKDVPVSFPMFFTLTGADAPIAWYFNATR